MPPKARGSARGAPRGRGSSRGGTSLATAATPLEQSTESVTATEALPALDAVVPKAEDVYITATEGLNLGAAVDSQPTPSGATSLISSDSTARLPVPRLDDLKNTAPPSRSTSPAARRGTTRGAKKAAVKPTFTGRRSKEERDARDKLDRERQKERDAEAEAKQRWKEKAALRAAMRANPNANKRGGYTGPISGPFSLGSSTQDRKTNHRSSGYSGSGGGSGSRAVHIKSEYTGGGGGGGGGGGSSSGIKREDGDYVSSDDEEDAEFPRKDIDLIEISDDGGDAPGASTRMERTSLPVRIGRKEHHDRVVGINTEASAETPVKIQPTEATNMASTTEASEGILRKGKGKAKDFEITGVRKPYKGVWQDADEPQVQIKPEPVSDNEEPVPAEEVGIFEASNKALENQEPQSPESEKKGKARVKFAPEPVMQTDEDRQEWARFQSNLRHIRAELGPNPEAVDATGDAVMADSADAAGKSKMSVRDNNVYLFQVPPVMPDLLPPTVKPEESNEPLVTAPSTQQAPIKIEEGTTGATAKAGITSGFVGKLRVHESGRTTLDWGGTSYELNPGHKASYLQEVVSLNVVPEKDRVAEEDGGDATSYGRVKGKFVVVPAWEKMLG